MTTDTQVKRFQNAALKRALIAGEEGEAIRR